REIEHPTTESSRASGTPVESIVSDDSLARGSEPVAAQLPVTSCQLPVVVIEPVADPEAPIVTNEASGPAVPAGSASMGEGLPEPALSPIEGPTAPDAAGPAAARPTVVTTDDRAAVATNEATVDVDPRTDPSDADRPPKCDERTHRPPEPGGSRRTPTIG